MSYKVRLNDIELRKRPLCVQLTFKAYLFYIFKNNTCTCVRCTKTILQ